MHESSPELAEGVSLEYDLVAIIVHTGRSFSKGHNTAVCRLGSSEGTRTLSFLHHTELLDVNSFAFHRAAQDKLGCRKLMPLYAPQLVPDPD